MIDSPFDIGMLIYDGMTTLDFAGPTDVLSRVPTAKVFVLAKSVEPVTTDTRGRVLPDLALRDAPELDLLFIGGGLGAGAMMEDQELKDFLRARAPRAKWVTSVCTGARWHVVVLACRKPLFTDGPTGAGRQAMTMPLSPRAKLARDEEKYDSVLTADVSVIRDRP